MTTKITPKTASEFKSVAKDAMKVCEQGGTIAKLKSLPTKDAEKAFEKNYDKFMDASLSYGKANLKKVNSNVEYYNCKALIDDRYNININKNNKSID